MAFNLSVEKTVKYTNLYTVNLISIPEILAKYTGLYITRLL